ncbi:MAG: type II 3-dehydroquinate dehydratase [Candidatus Neomarinimicrobiota bacterium]|nr:MAG: type II 3-dehydroquinate dehydratase [Candidatus Marinimicrobia bacterium TMED108]RCL89905.1 MAG: type II 3-dehydroquinate dehydratase [bacterium]|tara:strand:+ start:13784 stop:14224 length:441 start_codon:yes stop_codon:yes gene_type:complete
MNIKIFNGPNLNLLGKRNKNIYGKETLNEIQNWVEIKIENKHLIEWFQSNHEGKIIDEMHRSIDSCEGIIINPGAFTHYSYAIRDAIESVDIPTVEVHLSNINKREEFRKKSVIKDVCIGQITGLGKSGYLDAVRMLAAYKNKKNN